MAANDGLSQALSESSYMPSIDSGGCGGGTCSNNPTNPTLDDYANIVGRAGKYFWPHRYGKHVHVSFPPNSVGKRHSRWQTDN